MLALKTAEVVETHLGDLGIGCFWRSPGLSQRELRSALLSMFKEASLGGDPEEGFEQAFSSLAYGHIKEKAPRMLDYLVGFQLLDRNDDKTKAAGLFGFKVADDWYYCPVVFLNGDLKGHEMLYIKKQRAFVPFKENWVNHLIGRMPHKLGKPSKQETHRLGGMFPNLQRVATPPASTKWGMAKWAEGFLPALSSIAKVRKQGAEALRPKFAEMDLGNWLDNPTLFKSAYAFAYKTLPLIQKGFDRFYGKDFWVKTAAKADQRQQALANRRAPGPDPLFEVTKTAEVRPDLQIVWAQDILAGRQKAAADGLLGSGVTDDQKQIALQQGYVILDKRAEEHISKLVETQNSLGLVNPNESGVYNVLAANGEFRKCVIIVAPQHARGYVDGVLVIPEDAKSRYILASRQAVWVAQTDKPQLDSWTPWFEGVESTKSLKENGVYVLVGPQQNGSCPFEVYSKADEDGSKQHRVRFFCSKDHAFTTRRDDNREFRTSFYRAPGLSYGSDWQTALEFTEHPGRKLSIGHSGTMRVPTSFKCVKLKELTKAEDDLFDAGLPRDSEEPPAFALGNLDDLRKLVTMKTAHLRLFYDRTDYHVEHAFGPRETVKAACIIPYLVGKHGLSVPLAKHAADSARASGMTLRLPVDYRVKYAASFQSVLARNQAYAPYFPAPEVGSESTGRGMVPATYAEEHHIPVPGMDAASRTDPEIYNPFRETDPKAMQTAQVASEKGMKEIFDTSFISGLLKCTRQESLVDRHIGSLMKTLNALGEIMLAFFWHRENFSDRYGEQDMPELEDTLRNAFDIQGDLTLFLKEKTVQGGALFGETEDTSGPDISQSGDL